MDPKQTAHLDPKLKEAYDRVMGTALNTTQTQNNIPQPPQPVAPNGNSAPQMASPFSPHDTVPGMTYQAPQAGPTPVQPQPFQASASIPQTPYAQPQPAVVANLGNQFISPNAHPKSKSTPVVIALGMLIFFAIYSLFWVKLFGLHLPFLIR